MPTNVELYHYGIKGMRWGHRKARPQLSGAQRSARRKKILKRVAIGAGAAAGAAALGYGAYRGHKYVSTPHGAAHVMIGALRAQQGIDRAKGAARSAAGTVGGYALGGKRSARRAKLRSAADSASILGNSARLAGGIAAKRAGGAIKKGAHNVKTGAQIYGYAAKTVAGVGAKRAGSAVRKVGSAVGGYALGGKHSSRRAAARSAADGASILGNSARLAGGIAAKRAGNAVRGAGSSIKDRSSDIRQKLRQGRAAAETVADVYRTRRKYQGRHVSRGAHAAHFAYDSPGEALYHFALDPYGRYAIL